MAITRTPIIDDDGSGTTGTVIDNAWKTELYNQIDGLVSGPVGGAWTAFTPTWGNSGTTQPVLGNGSLVGQYVLISKTVHFEIVLLAGSTTTYGDAAGFFTFANPPLAVKQIGGRQNFTFLASTSNAGGAAFPPSLGYPFGAGGMYFVFAGPGGGALVGPTVPFTWAANCAWCIRGTYQTP